jgi:hypothetical protein
MVLGVIIGVLLLLLLIGLVVLQGMIEWGGLDTDKWFGGNKLKDAAPAKEDIKEMSKPMVKSTKKAASRKPAAKSSKKRGTKK